MHVRIPAPFRAALLIPALVGLAACSAGDATAPAASDPSQAAAAKGSGGGGDPLPAPTPVPGTITGTWKGVLVTPSGPQATRMILRQSGTDVTGDAWFLVATTEQRLHINRGLVVKGTSVTLLLLDGNGKESLVRYAGQLSPDGRSMTGSVIDLRGPVYPLDLTLQ
jgi:hypothetical protein